MAKAKHKPPVWRVGKVTRRDSGGELFNAIHHETGREYYGCPSYNRAAIEHRVECLNYSKVPLYKRNKPMNPLQVLDKIFLELDGKDWKSDTPQNIAEILIDAGYEIRSPDLIDEDEGDDE